MEIRRTTWRELREEALAPLRQRERQLEMEVALRRNKLECEKCHCLYNINSEFYWDKLDNSRIGVVCGKCFKASRK